MILTRSGDTLPSCYDYRQVRRNIGLFLWFAFQPTLLLTSPMWEAVAVITASCDSETYQKMSALFRTYDEFFLFYLRQHSNRANRTLHAVGTALGTASVIAAVVLRNPWYALLWVPIGYGFSWAGHLFVEHNRPATWGHPLWSLISDFRMLGLMITGRLHSRLAEAEAEASHTAAAD